MTSSAELDGKQRRAMHQDSCYVVSTEQVIFMICAVLKYVRVPINPAINTVQLHTYAIKFPRVRIGPFSPGAMNL